MDFLQDKTFLLKVNQSHIKEYWAAILVVDFATEVPLQRIEGKVISGNISVAANSSTRRTGSMQLVFAKDFVDTTNLDNMIAINKKIMLSIGITNPFYNTERYREYGDTLWFKQGTFIITQASTQVGVSNATININIIDKMGMLNGICGGTLPASTSFHDRIIIDKDQNVTVQYPIIEQIIRETVNHFGGEHPTRIVVDDVPPVGRRVVKWIGDSPISFSNPAPPNWGISFYPGIDYTVPPQFPNAFYKGDSIGYMETDLTYPGELILKAGSTVVQVLDEIVKTLGNFEYFYDVEGIFHFQKIAAYDRSENAPLIIGPLIPTNAEVDANLYNLYLPKFSDSQYINDLFDTSLVQTISATPNYSNIRNDWISWGTRKVDNKESMVRYHLAIDKRPQDFGASSLCRQDIYKTISLETGETVRYSLSSITNPGEASSLFAPRLPNTWPYQDQFNWREELYRQALIAWGTSTRATFYDEELMAEWRFLFDPESINGNASFLYNWNVHFAGAPAWRGYNPDILIAPEKIRYWLDLIDATPEKHYVNVNDFIVEDAAAPMGIMKYSVDNIGRRMKVIENSKINEAIRRDVQDVVFIDAALAWDVKNEKQAYYRSIGQDYCLLQPQWQANLELINSYGSCQEDVRQMMYETLIYNTSIGLNTIPLFYFDVNRILRLNYPDLGISGDYIITQLQFQLGHSGQLQIQAHEALTVV